VLTNVLLLDTETTGLDDTAVCIEVAALLYSVPHAATIKAYSSLIFATENPAFDVNRIPPALLAHAPPADMVWPAVGDLVDEAGAIVAHGAEFDRRFVPPSVMGGTPWICSMEDLLWPRAQKPGESLVKLALAHDLGVSHAHRAMVDCDLLARLLTRAAEMGADLEQLLARGLRPKGRFQALVSFHDKDLAKDAGFRWEPEARRWVRTMAIEDTGALPFPVRRIDS
jgi:DNA polymerase-3 subunit epsilon